VITMPWVGALPIDGDLESGVAHAHGRYARDVGLMDSRLDILGVLLSARVRVQLVGCG